jgi:hypothetical protein
MGDNAFLVGVDKYILGDFEDHRIVVDAVRAEGILNRRFEDGFLDLAG